MEIISVKVYMYIMPYASKVAKYGSVKYYQRQNINI